MARRSTCSSWADAGPGADRQAGVARYVHYGHGMSDIPLNAELLALADEINATPVPA